MATILISGQTVLLDDMDLDWLRAQPRSLFLLGSGKYWYPAFKYKGSTLFLHRFVTKVQRGLYVDHIDHNTLNNLRSNLRICTQSENQGNRRKTANKTSIYKGVSKARHRWMSVITKEGKNYFLGYFLTEIEAAAAYDVAAKKIFGEFALLNGVG